MSPVMFNHYFKQKFSEYIYKSFALKEQELAGFLQQSRSTSIKGFNVTMPYKEKVIPYLDELDPSAEILDTVNVIQIKRRQLKGYNTDIQGFLRTIKEGLVYRPDQAVVLGAGGAAKCVIYSLFKLGVNGIDFFSRSPVRIGIIKKALVNSGRLTGHEWNSELIETCISHSDLVVNTTPVGMFPQTKDSPAEIKFKAKSDALAVDLIYNPLETKFLKNAGKKGYRTLNGLDMLIYQGVEALKIWLGVPLDDDLFIQESRQVIQKELS